MKLLLDMGNSSCKWARSTGLDFNQVGFIEYQNDDNIQRAQTVLRMLDIKNITQVHIVSVLGEQFNHEFTQQLRLLREIPITFYFSQKNSYAIALSYDDVSTYGADRYCALVAAHHHIQADKIVIDCGTATTVDVMNANGVHQGGLIMPGVGLMLESLVTKTNGIEIEAEKLDVNMLANNTQDAAYSGCVTQMNFALEGIIREINKQGPRVVVFTGRACKHLKYSHLNDIESVQRPHLVLEGLQIMQG